VAMGLALRKRIERMVSAEASPERLARSYAIGMFLAFSPYLGIQTLLIFVIGWTLKLNTTVIFSTVYLINNPWTMIPIVILDYAVGMWIARALHINLLAYNPSWMESVNKWLTKKIGTYLAKFGIGEISFWAYFIGGHIIAISLGLLSYLLAKLVLKKMIKRIHANQQKESA
jgi:uncharacterized protein